MLWTRLAPDPLNGGGMHRHRVEVTWQVATDPRMLDVVRVGGTIAHPGAGHAVSIRVEGLRSDTWYYYQFVAAGERSRIGRTRTFPSFSSTPPEMRFALVSCQNYEHGFFAAYRDICRQQIDFVTHVGDYIYESAANPNVPDERRHTGGKLESVDDYRNRYALYRLDPDLQNAHAGFPFLVTWDDHEVDNNYAGLIPEDNQSPQEFLRKRENAYRVYKETMPLRIDSFRRAKTRIYRRLRFGALAELFMLDCRQYRTDQPCGDGTKTLQSCPAMIDPSATMLGVHQEEWLYRNLVRSRANWNVLAQSVLMMRLDLGALLGPNPPLNLFQMDTWDGYQAARDRLTAFIAQNHVENIVVLSGDIHSSWAGELKCDFSNPDSPTAGTEIVCSGVTSKFGRVNDAEMQTIVSSNPHVRFFDGLHRGYALCTVTPHEWRTDFRAVTRAESPIFSVPAADLPLFNLASYAIRNGDPQLTQV